MTRPSLILVHGAATGAWIWDRWRAHLSAYGWEVNVLDLRGHGRSLKGDIAAITMEDYVADLESVTHQIEAVQGTHPIVGGWSMGGMVAMMYAAQHRETPALLLWEPSPPLEITGKVPPEIVRQFAGEVLRPESLGLYPDDPTRTRERVPDVSDIELADLLARSRDEGESGLAFRQNLRGISIAPGAVACPTLVIHGETEARANIAPQNRQLALYLGAQSLAVAGASHWGLVYGDAQVASAAKDVDVWLRTTVPNQ